MHRDNRERKISIAPNKGNLRMAVTNSKEAFFYYFIFLI